MTSGESPLVQVENTLVEIHPYSLGCDLCCVLFICGKWGWETILKPLFTKEKKIGLMSLLIIVQNSFHQSGGSFLCLRENSLLHFAKCS